MRTLILEDDDATRMVLGTCLRAMGQETVECGTIEEAMTALKTSTIDLLVMDLMIGETNSLGVAQYASYAAHNAEIILVTGSGQFPRGEVLSQHPSVTWILRKPLPLADLEAFVCFAEHRYQSQGVRFAS